MADIPMMLRRPPSAWVDPRIKSQSNLLQASLAGTDLEQAPIEEMAVDAAPTPAPVPEPVATPAPKMQAPKAAPVAAPTQQSTEQETSFEEKTSGMGPEAEALRAKLEDMRMSRMKDEQSSIEEYGKKIQEYESAPTGIDWRPLAGLLDQWAGGKAALTAAEATKPEAPELKREKLAAMREKLSGMKGSLSKSQYDALKDQLDSIKAEQSLKAAEKRLESSLNSKDRSQDSLEDRTIEKYVIDMSKRLGDANAVIISQKIDRLDQNIPGGLFGTGEVPGVGIGKNWSPQFLFTDEGSTIRQDAKALLVESIKAATGLAATEAEQQAQAQINGLSKSSTAREFREALSKQVKDNLARASEIVKTYKPEAQRRYKERQGRTVVDVLSAITAKEGQSGGGNFTAEKQRRLEELRDKKAKDEI
jgi:hypothetical protein